MELGSKDQGCSQTRGVRQILGQDNRLVAPLQGLVRMAKQPQGPGRIEPAAHPGVMPAVENSMRAMLLGVVKGYALLCVCTSRDQFPKPKRSGPQCMVSLQKERGVLGVLGQSQELLPQLTCSLRPTAKIIIHPQSPQHWEELRRFSHLPTQLSRSGVGF